MTITSAFSNIPESRPDPIVHLMQQCATDKYADKIDLSIGVYKSETGGSFVMPSVKQSKANLAAKDIGHDYTNMQGIPEFRAAAQSVIFGRELTETLHIATLQTLSGTGALSSGFHLLRDVGLCDFYIGVPAWGNYAPMIEDMGANLHTYRHYDPDTRSLDFGAMIDALNTAPEGSVFILQACCHNPTGVDLTQDQWKKVAEIMKRRHLFPCMDIAYQGFASGCKDTDAWPVRYFCEQGMELMVAQSFSKNMGLYSERAGCLHVVVNDPENITAVEGKLVFKFRILASFAPAFGARVATGIILNPELKKQWDQDVQDVYTRLSTIRQQIYDRLTAMGTPGDWLHLFSSKGMFWFSGLTGEQSERLRNKYHIYTLGSRVNVAGLNDGNIDYFCEAFDAVIRG